MEWLSLHSIEMVPTAMSTSSTIAAGIQLPAATGFFKGLPLKRDYQSTIERVRTSTPIGGSTSSLISLAEGDSKSILLFQGFCLILRRDFFIAVGGAILFDGSLPRNPFVPGGAVFEPPAIEEGGDLETGDMPCSVPPTRKRRSDTSINDIDRQSEGEFSGKKRFSEKLSATLTPHQRKVELIQNFYKRYPCTPINNLCKTQQYNADGKLRFIREHEQCYKDAIELMSNQFCTFKIKQFVDMYREKDCTPLFSLPRGFNDPAHRHYLSDRNTIFIVRKLLIHQFGTEEKVIDFLNVLVGCLDRREGKMNTVFVYGPTSSGKNFFFDFVLNFFLVRGQMQNIRKGEGFPYMDCVDRRVILFNEPNTDEGQGTIDTLKMLFGGDDFVVNVKFKPPGLVSRTPVIVLTNDHHLWKGIKEFRDRLTRYNWMEAPFLKTVKGFPNPKCFPELLESFNVVYDFPQEIEEQDLE